MESSFGLSIAGIRFNIESDLPIAGLDEECYQPFITTPESPARTPGTEHRTPLPIPVAIRVIDGDVPELPEDQRIFQAEGSWAMYMTEAGRHVVRTTGHRTPRRIWQARISHGFEDVEIRYEDSQVQTVDGKRAVWNPFRYPLDQVMVMYALARAPGLLLHAAGGSVAGKGMIFAGKSTAGKSTISKILGGYDDCHLLSDDRIIVRPTADPEQLRRGRRPDHRFEIFGTPWPGEAGIAANESVPLHAILFLSRGPVDRAIPLSPAQVTDWLMPVSSIPWYDREITPPVLDFCNRLTVSVPAYELQFKPDQPIVDYLRQL